MEAIFDVNISDTIHAGIAYSRQEHVERTEELYINPSNLWRVAECPASARKICKLSHNIKPSAVTGLTVDHIVARAIMNGTNPRTEAGGAPGYIIRQAEQYYDFLIRNRDRYPGSILRVEHMMQGDWIQHFCGIADAILYIPEKKLLYIIDHKTGMNSRYKPLDYQLQAYACMAYDELTEEGYEIQHICLAIYQPDIEKAVRVSKHTAGVIQWWSAQISDIVTYARNHTEEAVPDCYRCLLCPHSRSCPALKAFDKQYGGKFTKYKSMIEKRFN